MFSMPITPISLYSKIRCLIFLEFSKKDYKISETLWFNPFLDKFKYSKFYEFLILKYLFTKKQI